MINWRIIPKTHAMTMMMVMMCAVLASMAVLAT